MKIITLIALLIFLSGCLEKESIPERDVTRTDSALVAIERLMDKILVEEEKKAEDKNKSQLRILKRKNLPQKIKIVNTKKSDTLFLERTIKMVYTKDNAGELYLDSISVTIDSCFHFEGNNTEIRQ